MLYPRLDCVRAFAKTRAHESKAPRVPNAAQLATFWNRPITVDLSRLFGALRPSLPHSSRFEQEASASLEAEQGPVSRLPLARSALAEAAADPEVLKRVEQRMLAAKGALSGPGSPSRPAWGGGAGAASPNDRERVRWRLCASSDSVTLAGGASLILL